MHSWAYAAVDNLLRKGNVGTTVIGPLSLVIGQGPGTGNGEQKTRQRRAGSWLVARRSRLDARGFLDSRGEETARMADGGQRPGTGIRKPGFALRRSWLAARGSWPAVRGSLLVPREPGARRLSRAAAGRFARVPQARLKVATRREPVESGVRTHRFSVWSPAGASERRSVAPAGLQQKRDGARSTSRPRACAPWLLSSAPTSGLGQDS